MQVTSDGGRWLFLLCMCAHVYARRPALCFRWLSHGWNRVIVAYLDSIAVAACFLSLFQKADAVLQ